MSASPYESSLYARSRRAYIVQCALEYCISLLVGDAYLSKLLTAAGLNDMQIGVVSSLSTAAFLLQLFSLLFVGRIRRIKKCVLLFLTLNQLLLISLYFIPFLPWGREVRMPLAVCCMMLAYFCSYSIAAPRDKWAHSFVNPQKRGVFCANQEMFSLAVGMFFSLAVGFTMDRLEAAGNLRGAFLLNAGIGFLLCVGNFVCLLRVGGSIREETPAPPAPSWREIIKNTLGRKQFRAIVVMSVLFSCAQYLTWGFLGTYKIKDLMFSVGAVQLINIAASLCRLAVSRPLGRYADKTSYAQGIELALYLAAAAFLLNTFAAPGTRFFLVLFSVLYAVSQAGTNQNMTNILYSFVPLDYFVYASVLKASIGGVCGFLASLAGSRMLAAVQAQGNLFLGVPLYGQQLLSLLSCLLMCAAALFTRRALSRQQPLGR